MPVSPNQGSTGGGTPVALTGTSLAGATQVRFGDEPAVVTANTPTSVSVITPAGAGVADVTLATAGGAGKPVPFYSLPPPVALAVSPLAGPVAAGAPPSL